MELGVYHDSMVSVAQENNPVFQNVIVTEDMAEAGVTVLWASGVQEHPTPGADHLLVTEIFERMLKLRP
jgi:hypothetical protein